MDTSLDSHRVPKIPNETEDGNLYKPSELREEMTQFSAAPARTCYVLKGRGQSQNLDHPITIGDCQTFARKVGINTFHAYNDANKELTEGEFPYSGNVEIREYSAPKV